MRFSKELLLSALCGLSALVGCTKKDPTVTSDSASVEAKTEDQEKKVFRYTRSSDPKTLDPQAQLDSVSAMFISATYDTLLTYHYLKRPYELVPSLLTKMPEVSPDGLTYTFHLREGVKFQDDECFPQGKGRELVSSDVIYTLKRFADINVNTKSWFFLADAIVGLNDFRDKTKGMANQKIPYDDMKVEGLVEVDRHTFQIKLIQKNPLLLYSFASSATSIVPKEAVQKYDTDFDRHPVGTGPFHLQEYRKKQTMVLTKNPDYFDVYPGEGEESDKQNGFLKDAGKKLPLVDVVEINFIPESQPGMLKFLNGELDWVGLDRDNFIKMAFRDDKGNFVLNKEYEGKFHIYSEPMLTISYYPFNMNDPLIGKNKNLRKALAYGLNIQQKIDLLSNGRGIKLHSPVPLYIAGSEKDVGDFGIEYNKEKAKEFLTLAGYPEGKGLPPIEITLQDSSSTTMKTFEFLRNNFSEIGVQLIPDYKTWSAYLQATESGDFQIASSAWSADYPDGENFYQLFYGPNKAPGPNSSSYDNAEFNKLYEETRFMENSPERYKKFARMAAILQDDVPYILDDNPIVVGLTQTWVGNLKRNMMIDAPLAYVNVDKKNLTQIVN